MPRALLTLALTLFCLSAAAPALAQQVRTEAVPYEHDGTPLEGHAAWPAELEGTAPGVLLIHEWWGRNDYIEQRARQLAEEGYVVFALDMYGQGKATNDPTQARQWSRQIMSDRAKLRARAQAGLEQLKNLPGVDAERLAAAGYCFGGSTVMELAYSGADLDAVATIHGTPRPLPEEDADRLQASVLILHGAADPTYSDEDVNALTDSLTGAGADWMLIVYSGAKHAFTNPAADEVASEAVGYDATAAARAWDHLRLFLAETLEAR